MTDIYSNSFDDDDNDDNVDFIFKICKWFQEHNIKYKIDDRSNYNGREELLYLYVYDFIYIFKQINNDTFVSSDINLYTNDKIIYSYENIIEYLNNTLL